MKAMVLAAGRATRLRPVTDGVAKPALSFFGRSLLDRTLDGLARAGVTRAVVNVHHAPESIRAVLERRGDALPIVGVSDETSELLGTGGALVPVRAEFEAEDVVLVVNADCAHEIDLVHLLRAHRDSGADATLAVRPRGEAGFGALRVDAGGCVTTFGVPCEGRTDERHFLSVQAISPRLFRWLPSGGAFGSFGAWYPAAQAAGCRFLVHETEAEWHAVDSRALYLAACADWLLRRGMGSFVDPRARVEGEVHASAVHARAVVAQGASVRGSALLEGAIVSAGAVVLDSLVGPGAVVAPGSRHEGALLA